MVVPQTVNLLSVGSTPTLRAMVPSSNGSGNRIFAPRIGVRFPVGLFWECRSIG